MVANEMGCGGATTRTGEVPDGRVKNSASGLI